MGRKIPDLTNQKFHMLTAIECVGSEQRPSDPSRSCSVWRWKCDCGNEIIHQARYVKRGFKKSCGCHVNRGKRTVANRVYHGNYAEGDISFDQFIELAEKNCFYCNTEPSNHRVYNKNKWSYNGLDRIDQTKPHNLDNVVPCCWTCNERKSNWNQTEFLQWITKIYNHAVK